MPADATVLDLDVADVSAAVLPVGYPYIEVVACPSDLAAVRQELAPRYAPVAQGDAYTSLARMELAALRPELSSAGLIARRMDESAPQCPRTSRPAGARC